MDLYLFWNISYHISVLLMMWLTTSLIKWLTQYLKDVHNYWNLKGWPSMPILGNLHQFKNNGVDVLIALKQMALDFKNENFFKFFRGWVPIIVFHKAERLDVLFSSMENTQKTFDYDFTRSWLKDGLVLSYGEKWSQRRKIITPTFHFDVLKDYLVIMNENVETFVAKLSQKAESGETVDLYEYIGLCALDILSETAMGCNLEAQLNSDHEYIKAVANISVLIQNRTCNPAHWNDFIYSFTKEGKEHKRCLEILHKFTRDIIIQRNKEFDINNLGTQKRVAFLDMLLKVKQTDNSLTFDDIQEEVDTFMFEGHDTTKSAATWACYLLGSHPEIQQKVQKEIEDVFQGSDRHVTNKDLGNLNYLECVIKEALRTMSEDRLIDGTRLTKGSTVYVFPYMIHRDPKYFPDPEKFDPERFLPVNSRDRHPYAFVPFAAGRRNCIGQRFAMMELKVLLTGIFRKFKILSLLTIEENQPCSDVILKPNNGLPVKISFKYLNNNL